MRSFFHGIGKPAKVAALLCCLLAVVITGLFIVRRNSVSQEDSKSSSAGPTYAGSASCRECHEVFYQRWVGSRHGLAMQVYTAEFAAANPMAQSPKVKIEDREYWAVIGAQGSVVENGPNGEKRHPITQVLGGKNVYYFLTPFLRGRLQVLPLAYDVRRHQWFDTASSALRQHAGMEDAPLSWTHRAFTFNTSCYSCHVSQLSKTYDLTTDSYQTRWLEPGINCETCHGPAARHLAETRLKSYRNSSDRADIISVKAFSHEQKNSLCAACHAKLMPLTSEYRPGESFWDHFDLVTLEHADYYPDGRDLGENYTFTSWSLSPCVESGRLDCLHCHTSSGRLRLARGEENQACSPCHDGIIRESEKHSRHKAGTEGDRCTACHMPSTEFARMRRSDHSMLPPSPAVTLAFGSPNACNLCHQDRDAVWSDRWVRKWYKRDYQARFLRQARLVDAARKSDWRKLPDIQGYVSAADSNPVIVTSLIRLLETCPDQSKWGTLRESLRSRSPLVRGAAAQALSDAPLGENLSVLLTAVSDSSCLVRIRAAAALSGVPQDGLGPSEREALRAAAEEYLLMLRARPDDSGSHASLGNYYLNRGETTQAVDAFETALRLDPESLPTLVNAASAQNLLGHNSVAEEYLRRAVRLEPRNQAALFNLALLLAEMRKPAEAEDTLRACLKWHPNFAPAAYNLGILLSQDRLPEALIWCERAVSLQPEEVRFAYTLAFLTLKIGDTRKAQQQLRTLIRRHATSVDAYLLLGDTLERGGKLSEAVDLYRSALSRRDISDSDHQTLEEKLSRVTSRR